MVRKIFQQPIAANVTAPVRDIGRSAMARVLLAIIGSGVIVLATVTGGLFMAAWFLL
jgi:hypothetical protein